MLGDTKKKVIIEVDLNDKASSKLATTFKKAEASSKLFLGAVTGLGVAMTALVSKSTLTAARTETLGVAMEAVAKATGTSITLLKEQEAALKKQGITTQEARSTLTRFMQSQLDVAQATDIARVAQDLAVISGENSSETVQRLTDAIASGNTVLLKQVGINRTVESMYKEYARTLGKNVDELTEVERKQSMVNAILEEGLKVTGAYEAAMDTAGKKLGSLKRYLEEAANAIGMHFLPFFNKMIDAFTDFLKKITPEKVEEVFKKLGDWLPVIAGAIIGGLLPALISMAAATWAALAPILPFIAAGAALGLILKALGVDLDSVRGFFERLAPKIQENWEALKVKLNPAIEELKNIWESDTKPALKGMRDAFDDLYVALGGDKGVISGINSFSELISTAALGWAYIFTIAITKLASWAKILADNLKLIVDGIKRMKQELQGLKLPDWTKYGGGSGGGGFATGGMTQGGWTMVGERGAELVQLPRGSHVYNSEDTKQMSSGGGITINVNAPVTGVDNLQAVILEAVNEATARQNRLANYNLL